MHSRLLGWISCYFNLFFNNFRCQKPPRIPACFLSQTYPTNFPSIFLTSHAHQKAETLVTLFAIWIPSGPYSMASFQYKPSNYKLPKAFRLGVRIGDRYHMMRLQCARPLQSVFRGIWHPRRLWQLYRGGMIDLSPKVSDIRLSPKNIFLDTHSMLVTKFEIGLPIAKNSGTWKMPLLALSALK